MRSISVFAVALVGCQGLTGPQGERGAPGADGAQGQPGVSPQAVRRLEWVDRTGAPIGDTAYAHFLDRSGVAIARPAYVDDAGIIWPIDLETAQVDQATFGLLYFLSGDCTGPSMIYPSLPREALHLLDGGWYFRGDQVMSSNQVTGSIRGETTGGCAPGPRPTPAVNVSDLTPLAGPPMLPFSGPVHRELR